MDCSAELLAEIEDIARRGGELEEVEDLHPETTRQLKERGLAYGNVLIPPEVMPALPTGWSLLEQIRVSPADIAELPAEERKVLELSTTARDVLDFREQLRGAVHKGSCDRGAQQEPSGERGDTWG